MQKLITLHLIGEKYIRTLKGPDAAHGYLEEHLQTYLQEGWQINQITGFGGGNQVYYGGWVIVLLEKTSES
jgi:hypothetical protein